MKRSLVVLLFAAAPLFAADPPGNVVLVVHGGVGDGKKLPDDLTKLMRDDLEQALKAGFTALQKGSNLDAVEAAIRVLEDSPRYNAGKGAVYTRDGTVELDASIMEGTNRTAGAVGGVSRLKNPITAARAIMQKSEHVLMVGSGAERFCISLGCEEVSPMYFWTPERWEQVRKAKKFGTVGAVARDKDGHIAAGTSTGGMNYKRPGRLGDSPIIAAGTYADDRAAGISCTGHGETFIRHAVAYDLTARMRYGKMSVQAAADAVFAELPKEEGGVGGLIALDGAGHVVAKFNTKTMNRGWITADGKVEIKLGE